ncbi:MAG TPA: hypothetical protein PLG38_07765 [Propionibacteriaceae bacterium]|nr:hypothetical protein [Propionibacteriaceae bacterium]
MEAAGLSHDATAFRTTPDFPHVLSRYCEEVAFGRASVDNAAQKFMDEVKSKLKG